VCCGNQAVRGEIPEDALDEDGEDDADFVVDWGDLLKDLPQDAAQVGPPPPSPRNCGAARRVTVTTRGMRDAWHWEVFSPIAFAGLGCQLCRFREPGGAEVAAVSSHCVISLGNAGNLLAVAARAGRQQSGEVLRTWGRERLETEPQLPNFHE
jgi:hypothetical protein